MSGEMLAGFDLSGAPACCALPQMEDEKHKNVASKSAAFLMNGPEGRETTRCLLRLRALAKGFARRGGEILRPAKYPNRSVLASILAQWFSRSSP